MTPSLYVEQPGGLRFEVRLEIDELTVGRSEDNTIGLRDMNVSRRHFRLRRNGSQGYLVQDEGSRNGTLVNGELVLNKVLEEGDRIEVGGSRLTYRRQASPRALSAHEIPRVTDPVGGALPPRGFRSDAPSGEDARQLLPSLSETGNQGPADQRWRKLAEVATAINAEHDIDALLEKILSAVLALVPAKSAFLVLHEDGELVVRVTRNAPDASLDPQGPYRLSREVCKEAIETRKPVLTQDALSDRQLPASLSIQNLKLRSILCVPFSSQDEVLGVVYLDEPAVKPFDDEDEAVQVVGAFGELAGVALANAHLMREIATRERYEEELRIAARIQRTLLPSEPPRVPGLEIAGHTRSARAVGGDIYDFFERSEPEEDVLVAIGDVAGKGVGAGLVMASVRSLVHAYAEVHARTDTLLVHLNRVLSRELDPGIFISYLLMRYSTQTGRIHYTGAGHEHLVLYRPSTQQLQFVRTGGIVLGLADDLEGRIGERPLDLQPGDVICLYTDGATEAPDADGEEFGLERLGAAVRAGPLDPPSVVQRVMDAVVAFSGDGEQHDDLTVLAIRKT